MKLELKHLAPYLPYGLKLNYKHFPGDEKARRIATLTGLTKEDGIETTYDEAEYNGHSYTKGDLINWGDRNNVHDLEVKPILRPLTDLTNDIVSEYFSDMLEDSLEIMLNHFSIRPLSCKYEEVQFLLEKHFDVFGLIDKGLAIDINTLEK